MGTEMFFLIGKFEESDREILSKAGWELSRELTLVVDLYSSRAGLSEWSYPPYDLTNRSNLGVNHTTLNLVNIVKRMDIDDIPDILNILDYPCFMEDCHYKHSK